MIIFESVLTTTIVSVVLEADRAVATICLSLKLNYSVFHRFRQAKFADGGSILELEPIFATASAAPNNGACFKSGQS
jgi:hypothetical protein